MTGRSRAQTHAERVSRAVLDGAVLRWAAVAAVVTATVLLGWLGARLTSGLMGQSEPPTPLGAAATVATPPEQPATELISAAPVLLDEELVILCARIRDIDVSVVVARVIEGQSLVQRIGGSLRADEIGTAFAEFRGFCVATEELRATVDVTRRFERQLADIEGRVSQIAQKGCGPRFGVNWSYHVDRVRNGDRLDRYDDVVAHIDRALSYYEDIATDTCALRDDMNEELDALDARLRYDRAPGTIRRALSVLRGTEWPNSSEVCGFFREAATERNGYGLGPFSDLLLMDCSESHLVVVWPWQVPIALDQLESLSIIDGNYADTRGFVPHEALLRGTGSSVPPHPSSPRVLQWIIDAVCADRFTRSRDVGRQMFVETLPGWSSMSASRRRHYRDIFDGLVDGNAAERCRDVDYRTMWTLAEELIDRFYEADVRQVREEYGREYMRQYGFQSYVGRRLEENIYLRRIYELEYQLTPREVEDPRGPAALTEVIERLSAEYREDLKEAAEREHEMAKADLDAKTQIDKAKLQADWQLEAARVKAESDRDVARINQETEFRKLRAGREREKGFLEQVLNAAAPALGSGLVSGVLDRVLFPATGKDSEGN